jgi:DNA-directed RNA polymerase subunit L
METISSPPPSLIVPRPTPKIDKLNSKDELTFVLSGVNVSLANALRRTILSDIPAVVFRTTPYEENKATIHINTTRLNNELIKQRLSCIPIHIKDTKVFPYQNYMLLVNVENTTDSIIYVTTKDFQIVDKTTNKAVDQPTRDEIFPANEYGCYIDLVRLRPRISDEIPGEKLHLECDFSIGTNKEDGMFALVSTCSYGFTVDNDEMESTLVHKRQEWKDAGKDVEFETKNWRLLDGMRITKKDSFDFIIHGIGVFSNNELVEKACEILVGRFRDLDAIIDSKNLSIKKSQNTMSNCFDVILENEDYTIGKALEYFLYSKYFETQVLTYCGFKKMHPHDSESIIRIAYAEPVDTTVIIGHLTECIADSIYVFDKIQKEFKKNSGKD